MNHSNIYYTYQKDGTYTICEKATGVRNALGIDIFRHNGKVYDGKTGFGLCAEDELSAILQNRITSKEQYEALLQPAIEKSGLSPRYTQPDVRREQPQRDENRVLSREYGGKSKHYFTRHDVLENGLGIFLKETDLGREEYSKLLYVRLDGWMVGMGSMSHKDLVYQQLTAPEYDLRQTMLEKLDAMLADPNSWADLALAEFFSRTAEAEAHNAPIRAAREANRQRERAERERAAAEREQQQQEAYQTAITEAEQKLLRGEKVWNADINGQNLLLQLFRENNIGVPLRTQGWIVSSLACIQRVSGDDATYWRRGSTSSVIETYILKLIHVLEEKYRGD